LVYDVITKGVGCRCRRGTWHVSSSASVSFYRHSHKDRGASVARRFAKNYAVALLARKPENFEPLAKEINDAGGKAIGISTDATDSKSVKAAFEQLQKEMGGAPLAAAVYNVGGKFVRKPFLELTEDEFESGWEANGYVKITLRHHEAVIQY
jgi:NAD(P)-dependent dehydrogenase (short-subunit alcohol dehydrogenase family)